MLVYNKAMCNRIIDNCICKRICLVLLTVALALSLFACGNSQEADAASDSAANAVSSAGAAISSAGNPQKAILGFGGSKSNSSGSSDSSKSPAGSNASAGKSSAGASSAPAEPESKYEIPPFRGVEFHEDAAEGNGFVSLDLSTIGQGYFGLLCKTDKQMLFQVIKDDATYNYAVINGEEMFFPLQLGDGHYTFRVMENIEGNKYLEYYKSEADVTIADPLDPFLRPNTYSNYTEDSECAKKAKDFAENSADVEEFIEQIYDYVCDNIKYDRELAENVQSGYLPDPDNTMATKKGICLDYASLAAAMLRSQGVPTKIIFGYVAPNDVYHAWNKFYTEEGGWTLVEFKVVGKDWNRIDLTFSANGADNDYIGDGSNYLEVYTY